MRGKIHWQINNPELSQNECNVHIIGAKCLDLERVEKLGGILETIQWTTGLVFP